MCDSFIMSKGEMVMEKELDQEWVYLMHQAKKMGIPIKEIRIFLQQRAVESSLLENKNTLRKFS